MKKLLLILLSLTLCALCFTACKKDEPPVEDNPAADNQQSGDNNQNNENSCKDGHFYSEWIETAASTCTKSGEERRYCKYCNHFEARGVVELGHNYVGEECSRCGYLVPSEGLAFTSNGDGTCFVSGIGSCTDTDVVIPFTSPDGDSVTGIGDIAFGYCTSFTSVKIPDSVTSIGMNAFSYCATLTSVNIGNGVTSIGSYAFNDCALFYLTIPNSVISIGAGAFYNCAGLTYITIPDSVTSIGSGAFSNTAYYNDASNWTNEVLYVGNHLIEAKPTVSNKYVIKNGTITIASSAFSRCHSLTSVVIPDSVTTVDGGAFFGCTKLTNIAVESNDSNYKSIDGNLYTKDGKTLIQYAMGKTETSFVVPDSVTVIGDYAFAYCDSLTSITIPDSVTSIGDRAFSNCTSLTSITIGSGLTNVGHCAFDFCKSLTNVYYKGSEADWAAISIGAMFNDKLTGANITYNYQN